MELNLIITTITSFVQTHLLISVAALATAAYLVYCNPKEAFKFLAVTVIIVIGIYFIMQLGSSVDSGVNTKQELTDKSKKADGE